MSFLGSTGTARTFRATRGAPERAPATVASTCWAAGIRPWRASRTCTRSWRWSRRSPWTRSPSGAGSAARPPLPSTCATPSARGSTPSPSSKRGTLKRANPGSGGGGEFVFHLSVGGQGNREITEEIGERWSWSWRKIGRYDPNTNLVPTQILLTDHREF